MNDEHDASGSDHQQQGEDGEDGGGSHSGVDDTSNITLLFLSRPGCSLCEVALPLVTAEAKRRGHTVDVVDITDTPWELYGDRIPVVIVQGEAVLAGRFDKRAIRRALRLT